MEASSQRSRRAPRPWTPQEQVVAEVAAACGVNYSQIGRALGRDPNVIRCRLNASAAKAQAQAVKAWHEANKEAVSAKAHARYLANREDVLAANRKWREANQDRIKEQNRRWRLANAERVKETNAAWRDANRDRIRQQSLAYHWANRSTRLEKARIYREVNKERRREAYKQYYAQNKEKVQESNRLWHEANRSRHSELARAWRASNRKKACEAVRRRNALRRAGRKIAINPLTLQTRFDRFALWANCCAYCGAEGKQEVDHVLALTMGGLDEPANVAPACRRCNASKSDRPVESWYRRQPWFTESRWRKIQRHCPAAVTGQLPLAFGPTP